MRWSFKELGIAALAATTVACGGGGKKINYAKVDATKKVAIVGVCALESLVVSRGTDTTNLPTPDGLVNALAAGFDAALPASWHGVQVMPFDAVAANTALPKKDTYGRRRCARGIDPLANKGYTGEADKQHMAALANALGVDAVVAITSNLGIRFSGDKVRLYNGSFNPMYEHMVDKSGEVIMTMSMKGLDSAEVPYDNDSAAYVAMGGTYGRVVADEIVKRIADR
jgi:hypothetical protein